MGYHTVPYHTLPYPTIPYHTIPYPTTPAQPYAATTVSCVKGRAAICSATLPYGRVGYGIPYPTIPYHTVSTIPNHVFGHSLSSHLCLLWRHLVPIISIFPNCL